MFVTDPCGTLEMDWLGGFYANSCFLTIFSEFVMLFEIAISISVSSASECSSCGYQAHNDFTNFSVFIMHCYICIDLP